MVKETEADAEQHVDDAENHRHLHLKRVQEREFVGGDVPNLRENKKHILHLKNRFSFNLLISSGIERNIKKTSSFQQWPFLYFFKWLIADTDFLDTHKVNI